MNERHLFPLPSPLDHAALLDDLKKIADGTYQPGHCGHPADQYVTGDEETSYCPACEDEARQLPRAERTPVRDPLSPTATDARSADGGEGRA